MDDFQAKMGEKMGEVRDTIQSQEERDRFKHRLLRTKTIISQTSVDESSQEPEQAQLEKCLTTFDLISLGVGSCCGTGMYVVAGLVAKNVAGPAAMFSFLIAAIASILSGVCYGEFGVRVPKTSGSAYMYSYVTVGEFVAFLIGWNLILEYMIGSAAGASALSACFDALGNHSMSASLEANVGTVIGKTYPDFLGFFIGLAMTVVLAGGVQKSVRFNNILNAINIFVWLIMIIVGLFYARGTNWTAVGFAPYGASGVFSGAATCFYAFIGFDIIATTGEEAKNPSKSIPIAIVVSLVVCLLAYVSCTMVLTLMVPYDEIHGDSALIDMFVQRGAPGMKWFVAIGAIASLTVSLLGSMFPMPRVIYAMSRDGLLFETLSQIHPRTNTPLVATIVTGTLSSFMSLLVGLQILVEMMSIGTLLAYSLVSISVLILRYQPSAHELPIPMAHRLDTITENESFDDGTGMKKSKLKDAESLITPTEDNKSFNNYGSVPFAPGGVQSGVAYLTRHFKIWWLWMGFPSEDALPNDATAKTATIFAGALIAAESATCMVIVFAAGPLSRGSVWAVLLLLVFLIVDVVCYVFILRQPQNKKDLAFKAPAVPFLPGIAIFFNVYLMLKLPGLTWARLGIWICIGLLLYFSYSMFHSAKERKQREKELVEKDRQQTMESAVGAHAQYPGGDAAQTQPIEGTVASEGTHTGMPSTMQQQQHDDSAWRPQTESGSQQVEPGYRQDPWPQPTAAQQPAWPEEPQQGRRQDRGRQDSFGESPRGSFDAGRRQDSYDSRGSFDGGRQGYGSQDGSQDRGYERYDDRGYSQDGTRQRGGHDENRARSQEQRTPPSGSEGRGGGRESTPRRSSQSREEAPRRSSQTSRYRGDTGWQNPFHEGGGY